MKDGCDGASTARQAARGQRGLLCRIEGRQSWGCLVWVPQGNWEEAEQLLQDAYEKDAKGADTLANLVVAGLHLGKNTSRYAKCAPCSLINPFFLLA